MIRGAAANARYFFSEAFRSIRENLATTVFTSITLGLTLAIFTLFLFVFINIDKSVTAQGDKVHILVYIRDAALSSGEKTFRGDALGVRGVKDAAFVSKEKALGILRQAMKGHEAALEGIDAGVLPASIEIRVADAYLEPAMFMTVVEGLKRLSWAEDVQWGREWLKKFSALLRFIEIGALFIGVFLAASTIFIITNTIRLAVYARQSDIEVMRLIGASRAFIILPFFIEGAIFGAAGGALSLGMLELARGVLAANVPAYFSFMLDMPLTPAAVAAILVFTGVFMGALGSFISTERFLKS
ncbi:MAG: ABC transporter permease [Deltaproteobacteria bacterium]|nr:ABC transporter permease [Deltaproteobacteria bacterium]